MTIKFIGSTFLALSLAAIVGSYQTVALKKAEIAPSDAVAKKQSLIVENQLKLLKNAPNFGFGNSVSNWAFLQFLQYFGDDKSRNTSGYSLSPDYLSVAITHDPYYRFYYLFLSESTTFYAGMPDQTVQLMNEGLSRMGENRASDSYYIWRYKGTDELLFLDKSRAAQESFEMAAQWAEASNEEDSDLIASLSKRTAAFLASNPDSKQAKISAWSSILTTTLDDETRSRAIENIRSLGGEVIIDSNGGVRVKYAQTEKEQGG